MANNQYGRFGRFFRPPRSETVSISDGKGGLIRDGLLILYQSTSIVLLAAVLLLGTLLYLWTFPACMWWWAFASIYCGALILLPPAAWVGICPLRGIGPRWQRLIGMILGICITAAAAVFYLFLWDWAGAWTEGFFNFQVPIISGWLLAALFASGLFLLSSLFLHTVAKPAAIFGGLAFVSALICWAAAIWTVEWTDPGLMYYTTTGALLAALWLGMTPAVWRLLREISDVYTPYGSGSDGESLSSRRYDLAERKQEFAEKKHTEEEARWTEGRQPTATGREIGTTDVQDPRNDDDMEEIVRRAFLKTVADGVISEDEFVEEVLSELNA